MYQRAISGSDSSRSVSAVGAQSTTMQSNEPSSAWRRRSVRLNTSSIPGSAMISSAATGSAPAQDRNSRRELLDLAPVLLEALLRVDLLAEQLRRDLGQLGADLALERVGEAVRGVGGHHERPRALLRDAERRRGGDGRLADAALAGEHDDAHGQSACRTRWRQSIGADADCDVTLRCRIDGWAELMDTGDAHRRAGAARRRPHAHDPLLHAAGTPQSAAAAGPRRVLRRAAPRAAAADQGAAGEALPAARR